MKKLLFVTTRLPYPVTGGRKVVLYNYIKALNEKYGYDIYLYTFLEKDESEDTIQPNFIKKVYFAEHPGLFEKGKNVLIKSIIKKEYPLQVSLYYSKKSKEKLDLLIKDLKPEVVVCDMARTAEYLKGYTEVVKILDMDDLLSKRYERQAENLNLDVTAFGLYAGILPGFIRKALNFKSVVRGILKFESRILKDYETRISKMYDSVLFVSGIEAAESNRRTESSRAIAVPIGVDHDYFSQKCDIKKDKNLITFLGNMNASHNRDAVEYFLQAIFPLVKSKISGARLRIVGKCSNEYMEKYADNSSVEVTGQVDDLREYVKEGVVSIAPLTYGSGVKTKILETMAMGVPVITNDIGAEGIVEDLDANNSIGLYVCGSIKEFVENIILLMTDEKLNAKESNAASEYIKKNFTWEMTLRNFDSIFNREKRFNGNENIICFKKPHKRKLRRWNKRQEIVSGA